MQTTIGEELKTQFLLLSLRNKSFEPYIGLPYFKDLCLRVKVRDKVAPHAPQTPGFENQWGLHLQDLYKGL